MDYLVDSVMLKNFKDTAEAEVIFNGKSAYLLGVNGSGKSTVIDSIIMSIKQTVVKSNGKTLNNNERYLLIPNNATASDITLTLLEVGTNKKILISTHLTKSKSTVAIQYEDGSYIDNKFLETLLSEFSIDPMKFISMKPSEQATFLGIDTTKYDTSIKALKDKTSIENIEKLRLKKEVDSFGDLLKVEKLSSTKLYEELEEINKYNIDVDVYNREYSEKQNSSKVIGEQIAELEKRIAGLKESKKRIDSEIAGFVPKEKKSTDEIKQKISTIDETNAQANKYENFVAKTKAYEDAEKKWRDAQAKQQLEEEAKAKYMASLDMPYDDLTINEDGELLYLGKYIDETCLNHAQLMSIAVAILSKQKNNLKTIFIKDGNLYDEKTVKKLQSLGYQMIFEYVKRDLPTENVILIEEKKGAGKKASLDIKDEKPLVEEPEPIEEPEPTQEEEQPIEINPANTGYTDEDYF